MSLLTRQTSMVTRQTTMLARTGPSLSNHWFVPFKHQVTRAISTQPTATTKPLQARNLSTAHAEMDPTADHGSTTGQSGKLWGGRFEKDTNEAVVPWAESLTCDDEMVVEDLWGSIAHVTMLGRQGIVKPSDAAHIISTLVGFQDDKIEGRMDLKGDKAFNNHDDVHMNMEARLIAATSMEVGGQMHTTRSRNDQVPVSSQLRTRNRLLELRHRVIAATEAFMIRANEEGMDKAVMAGYTHY